MVAFKRQFVHYTDKISRTKDQNKRVAISGQALPMSLLVQRYQTGQLFGLSAFPVDYEYDEDANIDDLNHFFADPSDPLALERAAILDREIKNERKRLKDEKEKQQRAGSNITSPSPTPANDDPVLG